MKRQKKTKKISGIGGWLLVYIIILSVGFIIAIKNFYPLILNFNNISMMNKIFTIFSFIGIILVLNSLVLIFQYSKKARKWNIIMLLYNFILNIVIYSFKLGIETIYIFLIGGFITYLWIEYWLVSKRIKNTFTED